MQTAHHPHRRMHTFSGLPYSYNLNLASAAPPLCHSYPFLTYNAGSEVLNNHGEYYHAMKSTSSTADKSDSISSSTDDEEIDNENSPVSNHSPSHPLRDVKHPYPSTVVGYPTLPAECAAMIPAINCHRPQKRYFSQENNSHRKNVYSKPFTIEAILGLENRMLFANNSGHSNNTNTNFSENAKIVYSPEKKSSDKHFPTNRSGKEFRRNLNTKLTDKVAKSKRVRTIFTPEQLERLENEFERQQYMVGPERLYLASSLNLTEAQVKVWFQNRRIKWRKQHLEHQQAQLAKIRENDDQETNYHHVSRQSDEIMPFADDPNTPTTEDEEDRMLT